MLQKVILYLALACFISCCSSKKIKDNEVDTPPPPGKKFLIKGGSVEMQLSDDEKIRVKPKNGGAFFELSIDY